MRRTDVQCLTCFIGLAFFKTLRKEELWIKKKNLRLISEKHFCAIFLRRHTRYLLPKMGLWPRQMNACPYATSVIRNLLRPLPLGKTKIFWRRSFWCDRDPNPVPSSLDVGSSFDASPKEIWEIANWTDSMFFFLRGGLGRDSEKRVVPGGCGDVGTHGWECAVS